jgi:CRISPR-associated protein Csm1
MQIFLEGKLLGVNDFLLAPATRDADQVFTGRSHWISLLSEVLPRALLAELGLSKMLLGSSGGGQFLAILPEETRSATEEFLSAAAREIGSLSGNALKLIWSITENLGDWSDIRKRLNEGLDRRRSAPAFDAGSSLFTGSVSVIDAAAEEYFVEQMGFPLRDAESVAWSPETPGRVLTGNSKHTWPLTASTEAIPLARHTAPSEDGNQPATTSELAARASGESSWGVLAGDVDNFAIRMQKAQSVEEHLQLSVMYKQFFAGELEVLCSMPEFWRKVTVIYSGGDDFAVYGAWDALIALSVEIERLFRRFVEANLREFTGPEGKTITMAMALAPSVDASLGAVFEDASHRLEAAKSSDKDCVWILGRTLEWKQLTEASTLKDLLGRMIRDHGCSPQYLRDLCGIYRESQARVSKRQARKSGGERPWRYHRRIRRILNASRTQSAERGDFQKARTALIAELIGRSAIAVKLRPAGRVALEWA